MPQNFDSFAKYYDFALAPLEKFYLRKLRSEAMSHIPSESIILEIGAGTGANFALYPPSRQAIATEISINMIEISKNKSSIIDIVQADAENLPFPASSFDAAFATLVFCSIPEPEIAFAEIVRTVRPGGRVVLLEHVRPDGMMGYFFDFLNIFTRSLFNDHFNRRTAEIAKSSGLKIIETHRKAFGVINLIICESPN